MSVNDNSVRTTAMASVVVPKQAKVEQSSESLTSAITIILIIAIIFLLCAVVVVTKNSFNKPQGS
jgi:hypothetical protein